MSKHELLELLCKYGAILLADVAGGATGFKLKDHQLYPEAPLSPFFLNLRGEPKGKLPPFVLQKIGETMAEELGLLRYQKNYFYIAGIPQAGLPLAEAYCNWMCQRFSQRFETLTLAKEELANGSRRILPIVKESFDPKRVVLVLDDLVTSCVSKIEAIDALRELKLVVHQCFVLIDRSEGAKGELMRQCGVELRSVFEFSEITRWLKTSGNVSETILSQIETYQRRLEEYIAAQKAQTASTLSMQVAV